MQSINLSAVSTRLDLELTPDQHAAISMIAERFGLQREDVLAWTFALLQRYVAAGGEP
jgi:hypothetical protein